MQVFLLILHVLVCIFLILIVLLQSGKGAEMGAAFGGSSQTLFGSRGAATFLNKLTTVAAVVFMITSLLLTMLTTKGSSVIQNVPTEQGTPAPMQLPQPQQLPQQPIQQTAPQPPVPAAPAAK
ncbi:MAG TPA: preprotein translocase subunit SecG [Dissulfurispiraceae bacterium]|nr:preprotein translocase subunit SecG [Dissulfurispiraceae bacterium]